MKEEERNTCEEGQNNANEYTDFVFNTPIRSPENGGKWFSLAFQGGFEKLLDLNFKEREPKTNPGWETPIWFKTELQSIFFVD